MPQKTTTMAIPTARLLFEMNMPAPPCPECALPPKLNGPFCLDGQRGKSDGPRPTRIGLVVAMIRIAMIGTRSKLRELLRRRGRVRDLLTSAPTHLFSRD